MSTIDIVWVFAFQRKSNVAVTLAVACKYAVQDRRAPIRLRSGQAVTRPTTNGRIGRRAVLCTPMGLPDSRESQSEITRFRSSTPRHSMRTMDSTDSNAVRSTYRISLRASASS